MGIVKLVCQGCGANLDALDDQRVIQCGYCGTSNQIKQTIPEQPAPDFNQAAPQPPPQHFQQPIQFHVPTVAQPKARTRGVLVFVIIMALLPLVLGGLITYMVTQTTQEAFESVGLGGGTPAAGAPGVGARKYRWDSGRPIVSDVDGDGSEDVVGLIQEQGSQALLLTAISGSDWATLWEVEIGKRSDISGKPLIRYEPQNQLLLFAAGTSLTAYDAKTGQQRWAGNLSDAVAAIALDGDHLWVGTIDKKASEVALVDGKIGPGEGEPSDAATLLRDDEGYELIPELRSLDLKSKQFDNLRVEQVYCPEHALPFHVGRRTGKAALRCDFAHGLAFATRAEGTKVPYFVGYEPGSKAERWRVQMTKPGTLETIETGFAQPRAELFGDDAVVSFKPQGGQARIRRIGLRDGASKWEVGLPSKPAANVDGMVVGKGRVFVSYAAGIHVLDLAKGETEAVLGGW